MKLATVKIANGDIEVLRQALIVLENEELNNLAQSLQIIIRDFEEALEE